MARPIEYRIRGIRWYIQTGNVLRPVGVQLTKRLHAVGRHLRGKIKDNISVPVLRLGKGVVARSLPGQYPRKDTGDLRRSIQYHKPRGHIVQVGTSSPYALALEFGHHLWNSGTFVAPRPFLMRTFVQEFPAIAKILLSPVGRMGGGTP